MTHNQKNARYFNLQSKQHQQEILHALQPWGCQQNTPFRFAEVMHKQPLGDHNVHHYLHFVLKFIIIVF